MGPHLRFTQLEMDKTGWYAPRNLPDEVGGSIPPQAASMNRSSTCISKRFYELMGVKVIVDQVVGSSPTHTTN